MKTSKLNLESKELLGKIHQARRRLALAGRAAKTAEKKSELAKRRRKEARKAAKRARKEAKAAQAELADAREALAKLTKKLAKAVKAAAKSQKSATKKAAVKRKQSVGTTEMKPEASRTQPIPLADILKEERIASPNVEPSPTVRSAVEPDISPQRTEAS